MAGEFAQKCCCGALEVCRVWMGLALKELGWSLERKIGLEFFSQPGLSLILMLRRCQDLLCIVGAV